MITLVHGDALDHYRHWEAPTVIVSDGAYGVSGFDGDLDHHSGLADWYAPHVEAWSRQSTAFTTLWFWNTEVGWAEVHPVLKANGWLYRSANVWDKGNGHIAGRTNSKTLRRYPVVTELCVHYVRKTEFVSPTGETMQKWLRSEWQRTGIPFNKANEACGVRNAATRKYLTADHVWYPPPTDVFKMLTDYANLHGDPSGRPYFDMSGSAANFKRWDQRRGKFYCDHGITNVWHEPTCRGAERIKGGGGIVHPNQKPLVLMERIVRASSDEGDVVWEPFGGLCSASVAAHRLGRRAFAAESNPSMHRHAMERVDAEHAALFSEATNDPSHRSIEMVDAPSLPIQRQQGETTDPLPSRP